MSNKPELKNTNTIQEEKVKAVGHNMMVYKNNLLGYFNKNNIYIINQDIINNLLETDKLYAGRNDNIIKLTSYFYGVGTISFELKLEENDGKGVAKLYIIEPIAKVNGLVSQNLRTKIATYENDLKNEFYEKVAYSFNIVDESEQMENPDIEKAHTSYLYNRKKFNEKMVIDEETAFNKVYKELFDVQYKYLFSTKSNFCNDVKSLFDERQSKYEKSFLKSGKKPDYFAMYELLILCIDEVVSKHPEYNDDEAEFYKNTLPAIKFALEQLRKIGQRFKENQIKNIQKMNQENMDKEVQAFLNVLQNGDKIKDDRSLINNNFYKFGRMSNEENFEINGLRQYRCHRHRRFREFDELKLDELKELGGMLTAKIVAVLKNVGFDFDEVKEDKGRTANVLIKTIETTVGDSDITEHLLAPHERTSHMNPKDELSRFDHYNDVAETEETIEENEYGGSENESNEDKIVKTIGDDFELFND